MQDFGFGRSADAAAAAAAVGLDRGSGLEHGFAEVAEDFLALADVEPEGVVEGCHFDGLGGMWGCFEGWCRCGLMTLRCETLLQKMSCGGSVFWDVVAENELG